MSFVDELSKQQQMTRRQEIVIPETGDTSGSEEAGELIIELIKKVYSAIITKGQRPTTIDSFVTEYRHEVEVSINFFIYTNDNKETLLKSWQNYNDYNKNQTELSDGKYSNYLLSCNNNIYCLSSLYVRPGDHRLAMSIYVKNIDSIRKILHSFESKIKYEGIPWEYRHCEYRNGFSHETKNRNSEDFIKKKKNDIQNSHDINPNEPYDNKREIGFGSIIIYTYIRCESNGNIKSNTTSSGGVINKKSDKDNFVVKTRTNRGVKKLYSFRYIGILYFVLVNIYVISSYFTKAPYGHHMLVLLVTGLFSYTLFSTIDYNMEKGAPTDKVIDYPLLLYIFITAVDWLIFAFKYIQSDYYKSGGADITIPSIVAFLVAMILGIIFGCIYSKK